MTTIRSGRCGQSNRPMGINCRCRHAATHWAWPSPLRHPVLLHQPPLPPLPSEHSSRPRKRAARNGRNEMLQKTHGRSARKRNHPLRFHCRRGENPNPNNWSWILIRIRSRRPPKRWPNEWPGSRPNCPRNQPTRGPSIGEYASIPSAAGEGRRASAGAQRSDFTSLLVFWGKRVLQTGLDDSVALSRTATQYYQKTASC